jgi:hypothetical protein
MAFGFVLILVQRDGKPQTARCSGLSYPLFSLGYATRQTSDILQQARPVLSNIFDYFLCYDV